MRKLPIVTLVLAAATLAGWVAVALVLRQPLWSTQHSMALVDFGAATRPLVAGGEWWRLITSQFLHVRAPHFLFNLLAMVILGTMLERALGATRFAILYLVTGVLGQLAAVFASPASGVASGASQALMGVAAALIVVALPRGAGLPPAHGRGARRPRPLAAAAVYIAVQIALDVVYARTLKPGHLAGLIAGAVIVFLLRAVAMPHRNPDEL